MNNKRNIAIPDLKVPESLKEDLKNITVVIDKESELFRREKRKTTDSILNLWIPPKPPETIPQKSEDDFKSGWVCPKCKTIYSPFVESCKVCLSS